MIQNSLIETDLKLRLIALDKLLLDSLQLGSYCDTSLLNEYESLKLQIKDILTEIYQTLSYKPDNLLLSMSDQESALYVKDLVESCLKRAEYVLQSQVAKEEIRSEILQEVADPKNADYPSNFIAKRIVEKEYKRCCVDLLLFESVLRQTKNKNLLLNFEGRTLVEAYRNLRNKLIDLICP